MCGKHVAPVTEWSSGLPDCYSWFFHVILIALSVWTRTSNKTLSPLREPVYKSGLCVMLRRTGRASAEPFSVDRWSEDAAVICFSARGGVNGRGYTDSVHNWLLAVASLSSLC